MRYSEYLQQFARHPGLGSLDEHASVVEGGTSYPLLRFTVDGQRWLVVTAGFHGNEVAGPLTLLEHLPQIVAYARDRGVGLRIYPCVNPSGFEDGTRYNRSGERPNNDFLRYRTPSGAIVGELAPGQAFQSWAVFDGGPQETRALRRDLERHPAPAAALDIHQDPFIAGSLAYAYVFGDSSIYRPLLAAATGPVEIARGTLVDEANRLSTDAEGFVDFRDGSVTDYFDRRGTRFTATLETTAATPMSCAHAINLAWLHGFIELAARS